MKKIQPYIIGLLLLILVYGLAVGSNMSAYISAKKTDSGMSFGDFEGKFKGVGEQWTKEELVKAFSEPDSINDHKGTLYYKYEWHSYEYSLFFRPTNHAQGHNTFIFKDDIFYGKSSSANGPSK